MDEEREQDELEKKLGELEEEVEQIKAALDGLEPEERTPEAYIEKRDGAVIIHWLEADLPTRFDAQILFNAHYTSSLLSMPVKHGDVIAIDGDCRWFGMCVVANELHQFNPGGEDSVEFIIWGGCECACGASETIEELALGDHWNVSLGNCINFTDTMSVSIYSSDSTGTTLRMKIRAFTLNKCGEIINIAEEEDHRILIPCCASPWDDGCECDPGGTGTIWVLLTEPDTMGPPHPDIETIFELYWNPHPDCYFASTTGSPAPDCKLEFNGANWILTLVPSNSSGTWDENVVCDPFIGGEFVDLDDSSGNTTAEIFDYNPS